MSTESAPPARAPEWAPEHAVDSAEAAALLAGQFPRLRGASVTPLETGWDNTVHLVDGTWVVRFPRRSVALPGVRREAAVLPRVAPHLPLPVPVPTLLGVPTDTYPYPFWGARLLPGVELADARLADDARTDAARALGAFLRALHAPALAADVDAALAAVAHAGPTAGGEAGDAAPSAAPPGPLPVDPLGRADPSVRAPRARERLARLVRQGLVGDDLAGRGAALPRLLDDAESLGPPGGDTVLVHGDLHVRHLLVDEAGAAAAVIDWGDVCRADPAVDLALAYAGFRGDARAALLEAYGRPVGAEREARARVLAVFLSAALAEYAAAEDRAALRDEALAGLRRAGAG